MKGIVIVGAIILLLVALSSTHALSHVSYFQPHGCHYIKKLDDIGNHIYVCPKKK